MLSKQIYTCAKIITRTGQSLGRNSNSMGYRWMSRADNSNIGLSIRAIMVYTAYVVLASGDDYAALRAFEGFGHEPEFFVYMKIHGNTYETDDYDIEIRKFEFVNETAFKEATRMLECVVELIQDYDRSKHKDFRIVSERDLQNYKHPQDKQQHRDDWLPPLNTDPGRS